MTSQTWRHLDPDERMTYMVGRVVRSAVELDGMSREAFASLSGDDPRLAEQALQHFVPRIRKMEDLLTGAPLNSSEIEHAGAALEAARHSYEKRNRFIHDDLIQGSSDEWFMNRFDRKPGAVREAQRTVSLTALEECDRDLRRAAWRMWALHKLLRTSRTGGSVDERRNWETLLADRFDLHPGNTVSYSH